MSDIYKAMKHAPERGQVRRKMWRTLVPVSETDPEWLGRVKAYWERQERTFGIVMAAAAMYYDHENMVVKTIAIIDRVLPGERI